MDRRRVASKIYRIVFCGLLFFVAAAASFHGAYNKWHFREAGVSYGSDKVGDPRMGLADILDGTADRPYVYRQLLPAAANLADRALPRSLRDGLYQRANTDERTMDIMAGSPMARNPAYFLRYVVIYAADFLFAWLAVFAMYLVCKAIDLPPATCLFAPVAMILLFPYFMSMGGYFYDYPEVAFMALAVWMALKFDWWWMLPLVALATWNKESFLLIVLTLYPLLRKRGSQLSAIVGTSLLAFTSAAVYFLIRTRYSHNGGGTVASQWHSQLDFLRHGRHFFDWEKTYGVPGLTPFTLIPLVLIAWTVWRAWRLLPRPIRQHGQIASAINIPLFIFFCAPEEMRDLSMLYIVFLLSLAVNFALLTKDSDNIQHYDPIEKVA